VEFRERPSREGEAGEISASPSGLSALCGIAAYFRIVADPAYLHRELALPQGDVRPEDILRAARLVGLKARRVDNLNAARLSTLRKRPVSGPFGFPANG
jgi:ABC-type bacteriocin/lantibiotic exporter with double-glycine peptidase domain